MRGFGNWLVVGFSKNTPGRRLAFADPQSGGIRRSSPEGESLVAFRNAVHGEDCAHCALPLCRMVGRAVLRPPRAWMDFISCPSHGARRAMDCAPYPRFTERDRKS